MGVVEDKARERLGEELQTLLPTLSGAEAGCLARDLLRLSRRLNRCSPAGLLDLFTWQAPHIAWFDANDCRIQGGIEPLALVDGYWGYLRPTTLHVNSGEVPALEVRLLPNHPAFHAAGYSYRLLRSI